MRRRSLAVGGGVRNKPRTCAERLNSLQFAVLKAPRLIEIRLRTCTRFFEVLWQQALLKGALRFIVNVVLILKTHAKNHRARYLTRTDHKLGATLSPTQSIQYLFEKQIWGL